MLRTGKDYIESLRDGREVWIDGEQVGDVATHPAFAPMVRVRARIYDLAREAGTAGLLTYTDDETAERCAITSRPPRTLLHASSSAPGMCRKAVAGTGSVRNCGLLHMRRTRASPSRGLRKLQ